VTQGFLQMQRKFMTDGERINVFNMNEDTALDVLPPRVYTVGFCKLTGFFLQITKDKLELPSKIYGKAQHRVNKCIETYRDRTAATGILMTGDKGTGKSLLMSLLANTVMSELGLPVLLIKDAYAGAQFVSFIESIGECCLVFDEFGKMYAAGDRHTKEHEVLQKALLSLMDGVDKTKRMVILTENREIDINEFMLNRPSRVYYHFRYKKLDEDSITGYCIDYNVNPQIIMDIIDLSRRSRIFSFDMLQSIVEEHLRFNASIAEVTADLNVDLREDMGATVEVIKVIEKSSNKERQLDCSKFINKPTDYTRIGLTPNGESNKDSEFVELGLANEDPDNNTVYLSESDISYEASGRVVYETPKFTVVTRDVASAIIDYAKLF
jgi:hypothetical protein